MTQRNIILAVLLFASFWLAFFGPFTDSDVSEAVNPSAERHRNKLSAIKETASNQNGKEEVILLTPRAELFPTTKKRPGNNQLFSPHSWAPPPPPVAPSRESEPTVPVWPFTYAGKKQEEHVWEVYFSLNGQMFIAHEDEIINNTYKVKKIAPPNMTVLYLPLNSEQNIPIGAAL